MFLAKWKTVAVEAPKERLRYPVLRVALGGSALVSPSYLGVFTSTRDLEFRLRFLSSFNPFCHNSYFSIVSLGKKTAPPYSKTRDELFHWLDRRG